MAEQAQETVGGLSVEGLPHWQLARRQRIVEAALRALEEQEYEQIQIREVAQGADVALGTLYRYFSSKEHLYAAVLEAWGTQGLTNRPRRRSGSVVQTLRSRVRGIIKAFEQRPQFYKVHVLLQSSADPNAKAIIADFTASAQATVRQDFEALGPDRAADAATMMWSIINTMMIRAIYHGTPMSEVYRIADRFVDLLVPDLELAEQP